MIAPAPSGVGNAEGNAGGLRALLEMRDRADAAPLTGEGIGLALEYEHEATRQGVDPETSRDDLARRVAREGGVYLYPHPLSLARSRAEAERVRLADSAAYSSMCATWGRLGGLTTLYRYGADYFRLLSRRRCGKATPEELTSYRAAHREGRRS